MDSRIKNPLGNKEYWVWSTVGIKKVCCEFPSNPSHFLN